MPLHYFSSDNRPPLWWGWARIAIIVSGAIASAWFTASNNFAATLTAASPAYPDVLAAVNLAANGDTIVIPAGSATWSAGLQVNKSLTIQGAGTTSGGSLTKVTFNISYGFQVTVPNGQPFRLTGIYFDCVDNTRAFCVDFYGATNQIRVDHCKFNKGSRALVFGFANAAAPCQGVVDHCDFVNCEIAVEAVENRVGDVKPGDVGWTRVISPGTSDALYVEDCTFTQTGQAVTHDIYCDGRGGRMVCRNSTFTYALLGYAVDAHGGDGNVRGTRFYEFYNNTFNVGDINTYNVCHLRGGVQIWHDNTFNHISSANIAFQLDGDFNDFISDSYFWNNVWNNGGGSNQPINSVSVGSGRTGGGGPHVGNYYTHAPQSGQTFYPYTAYTYPHPLVTNAGPLPSPTASASPSPTSPTPTPSATIAPSPIPGGPTSVSLDVSSGVITSPFQVNNDNTISQGTETDDPSSGGQVVYTFDVSVAGSYTISAMVNCPDNGSNSFYVNVDGEPDNGMIWAIAPTSGLELRMVTWVPSVIPQSWNLTAGQHQLFVRGREAGAKLGELTIAIALVPPGNLRVVTGP